MAPKAIIIPVAVLAVIAVCMLMFICWWFPRTWNKGNASDKAEYDEMMRRRALADETAAGSDDAGAEAGTTGVTGKPQIRSTYVPPVTSY